jgi:hypothetical protein
MYTPGNSDVTILAKNQSQPTLFVSPNKEIQRELAVTDFL